jgi:hypothetical protein
LKARWGFKALKAFERKFKMRTASHEIFQEDLITLQDGLVASKISLEKATLLVDSTDDNCADFRGHINPRAVNGSCAIHLSVSLSGSTLAHAFWKKWLRVSERVGDLIARCVMIFFYFLLFLVPAIWFTFVVDKVGRRFRNDSYFTKSDDLHLENALDARDM